MPLLAHHNIESSVLSRVGDDVARWAVSGRLQTGELAPPFWKATRQYLARSDLGMPVNPEIPLLAKHPGETLIQIWAEILIVARLVAEWSRSLLGKLEQVHIQQHREGSQSSKWSKI